MNGHSFFVQLSREKVSLRALALSIQKIPDTMDA